ncbi:hypothetical protein IB69_015355 [Xanthomonas citri]|nr:hypothetical protein IB69_015355 [Xanthomonas citri]
MIARALVKRASTIFHVAAKQRFQFCFVQHVRTSGNQDVYHALPSFHFFSLCRFLRLRFAALVG